MKTLPKILYFCCFIGLAAAAALALNRVVSPSMSELLLRAVFAAAITGAPGLVWRKAWPLGVVLLPFGAYLLLRTTIPVPVSVEGIGGQYHFYVRTLHDGVSAYMSEFFPLNLSNQPELRLVLAFSVFWLVGIASFVGLGLRKAVPAIGLMLVLIGFGFTVDTTTRALWTALLFLILAACLLVLSRGLKRQNWRLRDAVSGGLVGIVGALLSLALLVAAPSAVAEPWQDWRAWDPFHQGASVYTFNWLLQYPELLNPGNNVAVMSVESSSPSYWKANALDNFTGTAWVSSQAFLKRLDATGAPGKYTYTVPAIEPTPKGKTVKEVFDVRSVYTNYLFVGGDPSKVTMDSNVALRINDMRSLHVNKALGPILEYTVTAVIPNLKPADVMDKGRNYPENVDRYLNLPFPKVSEIQGSDKDAAWRLIVTTSGPDWGDWVELYALNHEIVGDAVDPYDKTLRIEKYLRKFFEYSLTPPASEYSSPYAAFLFDTRTGYCQHFAGAMALLLRFNGIPSRVAVGFATGELQRGSYIVTTNNAHAWVEVYFPEVGWVAFDPTPGRNIPAPGGPSSSSAGFINPFTDGGTTGTSSATTEAPANRLPDKGVTNTGSTGAGESTWAKVSWLPWVLALLVLVVGWPVGRSLWRRRGLRRGSPAQRLQASLCLLRIALADYGVPVSPALTTDETFRIIEAHLRVAPEPEFAARTEAILFGGREATQEDVDKAEGLRREVKTRLRKNHGWVRTGLTWYGVPRRIRAEGTTA
jgi:transglutaminase-like putative cysteine protease